jgi:hypothetical protein
MSNVALDSIHRFLTQPLSTQRVLTFDHPETSERYLFIETCKKYLTQQFPSLPFVMLDLRENQTMHHIFIDTLNEMKERAGIDLKYYRVFIKTMIERLHDIQLLENPVNPKGDKSPELNEYGMFSETELEKFEDYISYLRRYPIESAQGAYVTIFAQNLTEWANVHQTEVLLIIHDEQPLLRTIYEEFGENVRFLVVTSHSDESIQPEDFLSASTWNTSDSFVSSELLRADFADISTREYFPAFHAKLMKRLHTFEEVTEAYFEQLFETFISREIRRLEQVYMWREVCIIYKCVIRSTKSLLPDTFFTAKLHLEYVKALNQCERYTELYKVVRELDTMIKPFADTQVEVYLETQEQLLISSIRVQDFKTAFRIAKHIVPKYETYYGEYHQKTLDILSRQADVFIYSGKNYSAGTSQTDDFGYIAETHGARKILAEICRRRLVVDGTWTETSIQLVRRQAYLCAEQRFMIEHAIALEQWAYRLCRAKFGDMHQLSLDSRRALVNYLVESKAIQQAIRLADPIVGNLHELHGENGFEYLDWINRIGELRMMNSEFEEAEKLIIVCTDILNHVHPDDIPRRAVAHFNLARVKFFLGQKEEAKSIAKHFYSICLSKLGTEHECTNMLMELLEGLNQV